MNIILVVSKQPSMISEIKKAADKILTAYHVDQLTLPYKSIGYFPENRPSYIFLDSFGQSCRTLSGLHRLARIKYPDIPLIICSPTARTDMKINPTKNDYFLTYSTVSDLSPEFEKILRMRKDSVIDIPEDKFFPLEKGLAFCTELTTPETVFSIRYKYAGIFTEYQFFVCIFEDREKTNSAYTNFSELYETLCTFHANCLVWQIKPHILVSVFYDKTNCLMAFINFRTFMLMPAQLEHLAAAIKTAGEITIQSGCIHSGLMGLNKSYYEAAETSYINRLYKPCTSFEEISSLSTQLVKPLSIIELERRIRNDMEYKNGENAIPYIRLWFEAYRKLDYSMENIQMDLLNLYSSIKYVIFDMYTLREPRIKKGWEAYELFKIETVEELEEWFCTWVCYTLNNVHSKQDSQQLRIHDALGFIENHLMENISLESVANYFFLNPSYFSTLFKKEMNETFISYVTRMKMQKAAELLRSERSVSEVAALLGYDDLRHFRTVFKKHYHVLPNEYKKQSMEH